MRAFLLSWIGLVLVLVSCTSDKSIKEAETTADPPVPLQELAGYKYLEIVEHASDDTQDLPLVIALHWMGSSPEDFAKYAQGYDKPVRILLPQAPYPFEDGFSFFLLEPIQYYDLPQEEKKAAYLAEVKRLSQFIIAANRKYPSPDKPIIMGASQGGDLSYGIAILYPDLIQLSCPLLATIDESIVAINSPPPTTSWIIAFHGVEDPIVPIDTARHHIQHLSNNGFMANLKEYEACKHDIPEQMQKDYMMVISSGL